MLFARIPSSSFLSRYGTSASISPSAILSAILLISTIGFAT
ncbi:MAG: hypothetical protein QW581_02185 [Archaeoglobaceae archaeon]